MVIPRAFRRIAALGLLAALAAAPATRAAASDEAGRPVFRNFRPTEYRGHPQVYGIAVAPDGLVYLSSEQGIIEYDGIRWQHLLAPTSKIFALQIAPDGRIWVGGMDEVGYYAPQAPGGPLAYRSLTATLPAEIRQPGRVRSVVVRADGTYYSVRGRIFRWREGAVRVWSIGTRAAKLYAIGETLYAHVFGTGLLRLVGDEFVPVCTEAVFAKNIDSSLLALDGERLLVVVAGEGFQVLNPATGKLTPWATPAAALIRTASIAAGVRLRDGSIALGTQPLGLLIVSADGTRVRRLDRTTGLVDNVVLSLAQDPAGGLWVGFNTGAARVELNSPVSVFDGDNGPPSGTIDCWGRHEGVLYAGAYDGLWRLTPGDATTGAGARFVKDPRTIGNVFAIEPCDGETLVAGSGGLYRLGSTSVDRLVDAADNSPLCQVISRTVPGRVYLGGQRGLTVAQKTAQGWTKLAEFLDLGDVHTAAQEADGTLWLGTYSRGFWRLPRADDIADWKNARPRQYLKDCGLPDVIAWTAVFAAPDGASLFTDKGSYRLDASGERCVPDGRFALPGEVRTAVYPWVRAANGDGWATIYTTSTLETKYPLGRFAATPGGAVWRPAPAGALAEVGFAGAAVLALDRTPAGEEVVWARGYHNTVRLVLGGDAPASTQWRALIRDLTAAGRAQVLPAAGAVLRLPFSREALSFTLAAPKYGAGGEVRFSTRLLGYSDQWSAPAANPEAVFTNLIGGPFTLEVRAHDAEGNVSAPATCTFAIVPPWHRTTGAYTFYVFVGLGAIGVFVRWRLGRAQREQRRLVGLVATRTVELAAARDQAEAASRAKSAFLAAMSHELRTPLNGVIGYAQILQSDARLAPDQRERVRIVQQSGEHLLHMINDVLDLAKIEAGKIEIRPAPFALGELLRDIAASHAPAAANKRLAFVLDAAADLPELVDGDAQRIRQVLDNLVGNAIKFTPQGRVTLRVEAAVAAGIAEIRFSVIDTGPGITAADQARLFHPFERAAATPADAPGTGLGLAISRALVESMGGALALQSEEKVGSTFAFSLRLPLAAQLADTSAAAPRLLGYEGPRRRVLVVDDHALNRRLFLDLLTQLGFECAERAAGAEAFRCLAAAAPESWPDLVICDVRMAGVDGLALTRALRASPHGRAVKILLTSASVLTFDREAGREAGADDFLPKPFQAAELHAKVGQLLALRWREAPPADCHPLDDKAAETAPVPPVVRATLHELLAQGDLEAFRAALARARAEHPASAAHWDELDAAAASFQLSRLRQLLG